MDSEKILVVGQGGGLCQLECMTGLMMALDDVGIKPTSYRAASAGAIVSALHCMMPAGDIASTICSLKESDLFEPTYYNPFTSGFWRMVTPFVKWNYLYTRNGTQKILDKQICDAITRTKVTVTATNMETMKSQLFPATSKTLMATSAIPEVFEPVNINGTLYCDGGVTNNIPTCSIKEVTDYKLIVICLCNDMIGNPTLVERMFSKISRVTNLLSNTLEREAIQIRDEDKWDEFENVIILQPPPFESSLLNWSDDHTLIDHAYQYALDELDNLLG